MIHLQRPPGSGIFAPEPAYNGQAWQFSKIGQASHYLKMEKEHLTEEDVVRFTSTRESSEAPDGVIVEMTHGQLEDVPSIDINIRQEHATTGIHLQFTQERGESFQDQTWDCGLQQVVLRRHARTGQTTLAAFLPGSEIPAYIANVQSSR